MSNEGILLAHMCFVCGKDVINDQMIELFGWDDEIREDAYDAWADWIAHGKWHDLDSSKLSRRWL